MQGIAVEVDDVRACEHEPVMVRLVAVAATRKMSPGSASAWSTTLLAVEVPLVTK
jgi:hypothetical protein